MDFVSRGCIDTPAFNALIMFCNKRKCNTEFYPNPRRSQPQIMFRVEAMSITTDSSDAIKTALCKIVLLTTLLLNYK